MCAYDSNTQISQTPLSVLMTKKNVIGFVLLAGCFVLLYYNVLAKLIYDWSIDDDYSHGFLIIPLALYFAWERRKKLKDAERKPSSWGVVILIGSLASLLAGILGVVFAVLTAMLLNRYRLSRFFYYPPLVFLALAIIYGGLISIFLIPA